MTSRARRRPPMPSDQKRDDEVGYRKPPRRTRFRKGQSGNPRGRPSGAKNLSTMLREELNQRVIVVQNGRRRKITKRKAIHYAARQPRRQRRLARRQTHPRHRARHRTPGGCGCSPGRRFLRGRQEGHRTIEGSAQSQQRESPMIEDLTLDQYEAALREDFATFVAPCFYDLNPQAELAMNWHLEVIAAQLTAVREGRMRRLIINLPPRHLKS